MTLKKICNLFVLTMTLLVTVNASATDDQNNGDLRKRAVNNDEYKQQEYEVEIPVENLKQFDLNDKPAPNASNSDSIKNAVKQRHRKGALSEFKSVATWTCVGAAGAAGLSYWSPFGGVAILSGLAYGMKDSVTNCAAYYGWAPATEDSALVERLNNAEEEFELRKEQMHPYNERELSKAISQARKEIGYGIRGVKSYSKDRLETLLTKIERIVSFPLSHSKLNSRDTITKMLNEHLISYSDSVHDAIIKAGIQLHGLYANSLSSQTVATHQVSFFLLGEAGVGKTATVKALADALGRPLCKISVATDNVNDLYGQEPPNEYAMVGKMGLLARCFLTPDHGTAALDPIIFIDEIHDVLNAKDKTSRQFMSFLKSITDDGEGYITDKGLNIKIPIKSVTFIFAANENVKEDCANALSTRWHIIKFTDLTPDQKYTIAQRHFGELSVQYNYQANNDDYNMLQKIVDLDASPGARVLMHVVDQYLAHQRACYALKCREFNIEKMIEACGGILKHH